MSQLLLCKPNHWPLRLRLAQHIEISEAVTKFEHQLLEPVEDYQYNLMLFI